MMRLLWNQRGRQCQDFVSDDAARDTALILGWDTNVEGIVLEPLAEGDPTFDPSGPRPVTESRTGTTMDTDKWRGMPRSRYTPK